MRKPLVVDSSVLISLNSQEGRLETRLRQSKSEGYAVVMPEAIMKEVVDEPKKFAEEIKAKSPVLADKVMASALRISTAVEQGLIKVETVNYRKYSKVMDNVRKHLSILDAKSEHAVKKGDVELIALVIQLYDEAKELIFVATLDKGLLKALKPFSGEVEYEILKKL
jgi:rRNA maturation endonuclease Nob1